MHAASLSLAHSLIRSHSQRVDRIAAESRSCTRRSCVSILGSSSTQRLALSSRPNNVMWCDERCAVATENHFSIEIVPVSENKIRRSGSFHFIQIVYSLFFFPDFHCTHPLAPSALVAQYINNNFIIWMRQRDYWLQGFNVNLVVKETRSIVVSHQSISARLSTNSAHINGSIKWKRGAVLTTISVQKFK